MSKINKKKEINAEVMKSRLMAIYARRLKAKYPNITMLKKKNCLKFKFSDGRKYCCVFTLSNRILLHETLFKNKYEAKGHEFYYLRDAMAEI